jgi:DNA-binding CsgD family transcriptional regulator
MEDSFKKKRKEVAKREELVDDVKKCYGASVAQEFYRCILKELEDKNEKERHAAGGVTIADACLIYLVYLKNGYTCKELKQKFGLSRGSANKLMHQMTHWVIKNQNHLR